MLKSNHMFSYSEIFAQKQRILFVTAHPDDVIVFFGALIHQLRKDKKDVFVLLATNGARGSRDNNIAEGELAKQRLAEETAALNVLGVPASNLFSLGHLDGEVESSMPLIGEVSKFIRKFKADIVCTHEPSQIYLPTYAKDGFFIQHRDHRQIGEAVMDAVYPFSRDRSFFPEHYVEGIEPHTVYEILLTDEKESNFDFDYTEILEIKKQALRQHKSQFNEESVEAVTNAFKFGEKFIEKFNYIKLMW
jgi:LmbE family N-acetylglucosaminyl deacetylase